MDENKVHEIIKKMQERTTEELSIIVQENDSEQWTEEAFEAIHRILKNREKIKDEIRNSVTNKDFKKIISIITSENPSISDDIRKFAINKCIQIKDPKILSFLNKNSADTSIPDIRRCDVIHILGEIANRDSIGHLTTLLHDKSVSVQDEARAAIYKIDEPQDQGSQRHDVSFQKISLEGDDSTCSNCGANSFEYDDHWKEYTCKQCGYVKKDCITLDKQNTSIESQGGTPYSRQKTIMKWRRIAALLLTVPPAIVLFIKLKIHGVSNIHDYYNLGKLFGGAVGIYILYKIIAGPQK